LSDAQKALDAIDKQNAAALESGSSRTFDPYGGTKGVLSVSDANGNVRAFDPYAGDSAKDADKSKALADSGLSTAVSNQISNDKTGLTKGELSNLVDSNLATNAVTGLLGLDTGNKTGTVTGLGEITAPVSGVSSLALDNLGDRPQTNPTTSLPTLGYTGTGLGLLGDLIAGSSVSLNPAPVETREAKPNPYAVDYTRDFARPMPKSDTYTGNLVEPTPVMPESYTPVFSQPTPTPEKPDSNIYAGDFSSLFNNNAAVAAAAVQAAADANAATGGGGGYGSGGVGGGPGGTGGGPGGFGPQYRGGLITPRDVKGPNPPGPDDGQASLDIGEYVIRKKAVQKYGANIFEQINAGKIPAKRLKSLLE